MRRSALAGFRRKVGQQFDAQLDEPGWEPPVLERQDEMHITSGDILEADCLQTGRPIVAQRIEMSGLRSPIIEHISGERHLLQRGRQACQFADEGSLRL